MQELIPELDEATYNTITQLAAEGDELMEEGKWKPALSTYQKALKLVPEPKWAYDSGTWLYVAIGDAQIGLDEIEKAGAAFQEAWNGAPDNPYVNLRLGQCLYELDFQEDALEFLWRAYKYEGTEIFEEEDPRYLDHLRANRELP